MANTNKAEELAKEYAEKQNDVYMNDYYGFIEGYNSRQSEIDELTKEVERLKGLNIRLFTLWENLYEAGEISISKSFSTSFNEIRKLIK